MNAPRPNRVMPHDLDAEQAVLGGCLMRPAAAVDILEGVSPDIFYSPAHRAIAQAMLAMFSDGTPLDLVTLSDRLAALGSLVRAGGPVYLAELASSPISVANARHHVGIVRGVAQRRAMIELGMGLCDAAFDPTASPTEFAAHAQKTIDAVLEDRVNVPSQLPSQVAFDALAYVERLKGGHGDLIKSSIYDLNALIGGYAPGETCVLAGRPGAGKTAFALCEAAHALDKGVPGGIFSLEMRSVQLALRLFARQGGVDAQRFRDGDFTDTDMTKVMGGVHWLGQLDPHLRLWDRPGLTIQEFRSQVRKWKREIGIRWVIIDYLQLMRADQRCSSREQEVAEVSRAIKNTALEYDVAVICLAQLNRDADKTKRPLLSQLRESGAVEADADIILFLVPWDTRGKGVVREIEIDVAKGRSNRTGTIKVDFQRSFLRFVNQDYLRKNERGL